MLYLHPRFWSPVSGSILPTYFRHILQCSVVLLLWYLLVLWYLFPKLHNIFLLPFNSLFEQRKRSSIFPSFSSRSSWLLYRPLIYYVSVQSLFSFSIQFRSLVVVVVVVVVVFANGNVSTDELNCDNSLISLLFISSFLLSFR